MSIFRAQISKINLSVIEKAVFYFLIYGFIGWIIDCIGQSSAYGHIVLGGMFRSFLLPIPFAPIYGFGALALIAFKKVLWNKHPLFVMPIAGIILTAVEYLGGELTLVLFHHSAWDYSKNFLNFRGHIDLFNGICWMFLGWAFIKFIHPPVEKLVEKFLGWAKKERSRIVDKINEI